METLGSTLSAERGPAADAGARWVLDVALFADRPADGGVRHVLDADEVLVGRGAERSSTRATVGGRSVLTLRFADPRMSSTHARLLRASAGWTLVDAGSKNGSRVGGQMVDRASLSDGDVLELGGTRSDDVVASSSSSWRA